MPCIWRKERKVQVDDTLLIHLTEKEDNKWLEEAELIKIKKQV